MTVVLLLVLAGLQGGAPDLFDLQLDLQGIYDEFSQAIMQFDAPSDIDTFHDVFYTTDWAFVDAAGVHHSWTEMREHAVQALNQPRLESMQQMILKLAVVPGGAQTTAQLTVVRTILDEEGKYGRKGATHTLTETTVFHDAWMKSGESWKWKSREQVGKTTVLVDHAPSFM
jgi:hypothetical protein